MKKTNHLQTKEEKTMKKNIRFYSMYLAFTSMIILLFSVPSFVIAQSPIPDGATVELIASGFQLAEGPYWHPDEFLIFSDVSANVIYKWSEESGVVEYLNPSGNANGIAADLNGNILICQHSARQVGRIETDGSITPLATHYNGNLLHSPNDLAVKSDGAVFFTDPPWGGNPPQMNFHGVYRIPPGGGEIQLLVDNLNYPNGIVFSPDETKLYINDSNGRHVYVYDVIDDSTLANATLFANTGGNQHADGMEVDSSGNLYVAGSSGVAIFSPDGTLLDEISVPGITSNVKWGGENGSILFITSFPALYGIDTIVTSIEDDLVNKPIQFQLDQNYPNPFNPTTMITYQIPDAGLVSLQVYNLLGEVIATLVNEEKSIGTYDVEFDAAGFPSGIYFYKLQTGSFVETKKMILLK